MIKLVTDKCPCCGTKGLNPKKIKDMCENCLETCFDQWRRKVTSLEEENAELKGELKAVKEILEELKGSYNAVIDEVIDIARGYGLVSDSALFCYINEYDNKVINYDELLDRIRNETIIELKLAIEDMKK